MLSGTESSRTARFPESRARTRQKFCSKEHKNEWNRHEMESRKINSESLFESHHINAEGDLGIARFESRDSESPDSRFRRRFSASKVGCVIAFPSYCSRPSLRTHEPQAKRKCGPWAACPAVVAVKEAMLPMRKTSLTVQQLQLKELVYHQGLQATPNFLGLPRGGGVNLNKSCLHRGCSEKGWIPQGVSLQ